MASELNRETDLNMSKRDCIVACVFTRVKKREENWGKLGGVE